MVRYFQDNWISRSSNIHAPCVPKQGVSIISACIINKTRLRVLVWLLNYQNYIVITNTGVFSVSIVDVNASNSMACDLRVVS